LDELGRMLPRIGVDRGSRDLDPFLRHDWGAAVDGFAGPAQDSAEHVAGHVQFDRLSEELHRRLSIDARGPFEHLDDDDVLRRIEDLPALARAVRETDLDQLTVDRKSTRLNSSH